MAYPDSSITSSTASESSYSTLVSNPRASVTRGSDGRISIFIDGNYFSVDESEIGTFSDDKKNEWLEHFIKFYDKLLKKDEEKKDFYKKAEEAVKGALKKVKKWYSNILAFFGVQRYQDIVGDDTKQKEAQDYYEQIADYKREAVDSGNRYFSACMSAFLHSCDKAEFV